MKSLTKASRLVTLLMLILLAVTGCKSRKKAAELSKANEQAKMEQEAALRKQQEEKKQKEAEAQEQARLEAERMKQEAQHASTPYVKVAQYFDAISSASTATSANSSIQEALSLFSSPETPVLVIISGSGDQKDYDKPTTIGKYLNYLKDQKKNSNKIENLEFDASGKISAVELRK